MPHASASSSTRSIVPAGRDSVTATRSGPAGFRGRCLAATGVASSVMRTFYHTRAKHATTIMVRSQAMATTNVTPIQRDEPPKDWDDLDHAIYDARIRRHLSLRATGHEVGLSHEQVRRRIRAMLRRVTFAEIDEMRTEQGHRLDELSASAYRIAEYALKHDPEAGRVPDPDKALKALREVHALVRTRIDLFGLAQPAPADPGEDYLAGLIGAYLRGVNDTEGADR